MNMSLPIYCESRHILCSVCKNYLSCGPILIRRQWNIVCGRCVIQNEKGIRNHAYEVAAARLRFPCKYRDFGCRETQAFAQTYKLSHEYSCEYRTYRCRFSDDHCPSQYTKKELVKHCEVNHSERLLYNCYPLDINLKKPCSITYLLVAFEMQFMLQMKVYVQQLFKMLIFELEYLGKQDAGAQFKYKVHIQKDQSLITKLGDCGRCPQVEIYHSNLSDIFGSLQGIKFHITVYINCEVCEEELIVGKLCNVGPQWFCSKCAPKYNNCRNDENGCHFEDNPIKILKHEEYFCNYFPHEYSNFHNKKTVGLNHVDYAKVWLIKNTYDKSAITTDIGIVIGEFTAKENPDKFQIFIYSPIQSKEEKDFKCKVYIGNPFTSESEIIVAKYQADKVYDWYISIDKLKHPSWGSELGILLIIQRIQPDPPQTNIDYDFILGI